VRYEERGQGYRDVEKVGKHSSRSCVSRFYFYKKGHNSFVGWTEGRTCKNQNRWLPKQINYFPMFIVHKCGPGSVVGIATAYGLDGPGIESRWGRDFPHLSRPALRPTQPPVQ